MIAELVYILCAATSCLSAILLLRAYGRSKTSLLFWSGMCFVGFALSNALLFVDLVILPSAIDLSVIRTLPALLGLGSLLYGMIWDLE